MTTSIVGSAYQREGDVSIRSVGGMPVLEETYHYKIECTSNNESYLNVINTAGTPIVNYTVSPTGYGICRSKSAKRMAEEHAMFWEMDCTFSSEVDERQDQTDPTTDPVVWKPVYETKFERLQETFTRDKANVAIANSAGQPFESGIILTRFIPIWEFYQFESPGVTDEQIVDRNETINSQTFKGRAPETLLLTVMSSVVGFYYGQRRRLTQYSLRYNKKKWTHKKLDVGTAYLLNGVLEPYWDDVDKKVNVILGGLDGAGGRVALGDPPEVLEFDQFDQLNFSSFLRI